MSESKVGIIGGSGNYKLLEKYETLKVITEYGEPSSKIHYGSVGGKSVYFIARHGENHELPPHKINYRANIQALYNLGVRNVIATHALGSLNPNMKPGDFVLSNQFINKTWGREDTFYEGPDTVHISISDPFCDKMRQYAKESLTAAQYPFHDDAVMLVIQGPRFNTRAENLAYYREGNDVISMTGYPETVLARERGMCYLSLGIVTDMACVMDSPVHPEKPTTHADVVKIFAGNRLKMIEVLDACLIMDLDNEICGCRIALEGAQV
ncbi:MTAP family purine nucleoside phosphorylase [Paenibacillus chitinolyticus]|uniref:MTAP family purine nucleoside phosphorylase n=1 Tax=Paenibacillus chitinolyticus TaxID=79263 RepID=UPI0035E28709